MHHSLHILDKALFEDFNACGFFTSGLDEGIDSLLGSPTSHRSLAPSCAASAGRAAPKKALMPFQSHGKPWKATDVCLFCLDVH